MVLQILKNKRGQGQAVEYAVIFFIAVAAIAAMTVYVKRGVQARIRGARNYAWFQVNGVANKYVPVEYEPYYVQTKTLKDEDMLQTQTDTPWLGHEGKYQSSISAHTQASSNSVVAAPKYAD